MHAPSKYKRTGRPKIWLYRDKETNEPKGDATITYEDPHAAVAAVEWFNNNWLCLKKSNCSNVNFAFRGACNRCGIVRPTGASGILGVGGRGKGRAAQESGGISRPAGGGIFGPNDWPCPMNVVFTVTLFARIFQAAFGIFRRNHHDWSFIQECSPGGDYIWNGQRVMLTADPGVRLEDIKHCFGGTIIVVLESENKTYTRNPSWTYKVRPRDLGKMFSI
ncbi:hypothetical protein JHK86_010139 [Glycine max]|nr:hypothetical protein JHK86_010139 [Glycine max]